VISIGRLSNATAAADYYLTRQAGCPMDYYSGAGERRGLWIGRGADTLHLTGELTTAHEQVFRQLLHGLGPDGKPLVSPVLRTDPRGLLDARPLVEAIRGADTGLLRSSESGHWPAFDTLARRVDRSSLATVTVRADVALAPATAAGIDARQVYADRGLSLEEALLHVDERIDVRRPGYDVVFSAPKSVSVVYGLATPEVAEEVRTARLTAIGEALNYLELFVAQSVRGHKGEGRHAVRVGTGGLIATAFEHRSSRADDPQLHTHVVIANLLQGPDGHWGAIDSAALYRHQLTAGYIYQAVLRGELTSRLGVEWTDVRRGLAEIHDIPKALCREFSQRRQAIEARLAELGESGMDAAWKACLDTRPAKQHTPEATQRERWHERALEVGFDPADLRLTGTAEIPTVDENQLVDDLVRSEGLTARRSTFDPRDILRGVCEALPGGAHVDLTRLLDLGRAVVRHPETVALLRNQAPGERGYSTADLLAAEQRALELVTDSRQAGIAVVPDAAVNAVLAQESLSEEQRELVRRLATLGR